MKILVYVLIGISLAFYGTSSARAYDRVLNQEGYTAVSATDASQSVTFTDPAHQILVINDGANEVFINFNGTTAAVTDFELKNGETVVMPITSSAISFICSTAETATVRVLSLEEDL